MDTLNAPGISVKPRVLIADDSRIVRASLIKHIEGMFEFREAVDGEDAWETLLLDRNIRVVITDLTMPKLDGYGLLKRIRSSKIGRIREIPVIVISGSDDESEERERAKAAGATDLITKGTDTAQLLSRLDILSKLVATQHEFERSLEALVRDSDLGTIALPSTDELRAEASALLVNAIKSRKNFVLLYVCVGLRQIGMNTSAASPPAAIIDAIGQLLRRNVRQTDLVSKTGEAEFMLATGNINFDAARYFARRVCKAIAGAHLVQDNRISFVASCGLVSLSDDTVDTQNATFEALGEIARRRAMLGLGRAVTGIVGRTEEEVLQRTSHSSVPYIQADIAQAFNHSELSEAACADLATLIQWIKAGRQEEVRAHLDNLSDELKPLIELFLQQNKL